MIIFVFLGRSMFYCNFNYIGTLLFALSSHKYNTTDKIRNNRPSIDKRHFIFITE